MIDLDIWEMFYNFQLFLVLEMNYGVDFKYYLCHKKDHQGTPLWVLWVSPMIGLVLSLYIPIQGLLWKSCLVTGDSSDLDNLFRWDQVTLNLHGDPNYSPTII